MKWFEISIATTSEGIDIMSELLFEAGVQGVVIEDKEDIIRYLKDGEGFDYSESDLASSYDSTVKVKGYLPDDKNINTLINNIKERSASLLKRDLGVDIRPGSVIIVEVYEQDWENSWKEYFKPFKVSESIVVKPTWESYEPSPRELVIELDPGMAFGTGTHETTILCIRALEKYLCSNSLVLDIGCGTGILGIAAILLGARGSTLIDIDTQAIKVAKANSLRNGTIEKTEFITGDLFDKVEGKFDLIIANLSSKAIRKLIPQCTVYVSRGGYLVVSGILEENAEDIKNVLIENGMTFIDKHFLGDWVCIVAQCV